MSFEKSAKDWSAEAKAFIAAFWPAASPSKVKITSPRKASSSISKRRMMRMWSAPNAVPQVATAVVIPATAGAAAVVGVVVVVVLVVVTVTATITVTVTITQTVAATTITVALCILLLSSLPLPTNRFLCPNPNMPFNPKVSEPQVLCQPT